MRHAEVETDAISLDYLRLYVFPMLKDFGFTEIETECRAMILKVYGQDYDKLTKLSPSDAAELRSNVEMKFFKMKFPRLGKLLIDAVHAFAKEHAKELGIKTKSPAKKAVKPAARAKK